MMPRSDLFPQGLYTTAGPSLNIDPSLSVVGEIEDGQRENYERGKGEKETSSGESGEGIEGWDALSSYSAQK